MNSKLGRQIIITSLFRFLLDVCGAGGSVPALEEELNRRVYGLFGVSGVEVKIIEGVENDK